MRTADDATSIAKSIVPDYVIHFMRGETPESLARKRDQNHLPGRDVMVTPQRDSITSYPVEHGHLYSSDTDLTRGVRGHSNGSGQGGSRRYFSGWRGGVVFNTLLSTLILIVESVILIIALTTTRILEGETVIFSGDCTRANNIHTGLRAVINLLAVVLLAGANYVFQVLLSPTRAEVDAAHEQKRWLNIGVPSFRNLARISTFRAALGVAILLVAVAIQVICNAVLITSRNAETSTCNVDLDGSLMGIVALLNLILVASMAAILFRAAFEPLATAGDAIRSFLRTPDHTTDPCDRQHTLRTHHGRNNRLPRRLHPDVGNPLPLHLAARAEPRDASRAAAPAAPRPDQRVRPQGTRGRAGVSRGARRAGGDGKGSLEQGARGCRQEGV
jgi:hypothetical protein